MTILLEYIIVFIGVLIINSLIARYNNKHSKGILSHELLYLKKIYHIDIKKLDKNNLTKTITLINTFIITTIYIILMYLLKGWLLRIIIGLILLILMILICYGLLGRYYLKKEGEKNV